MMKSYQFTMGPVQSFVAQARRTRDFWAGSFLLSYLTGKAMMAVIKNKGRIIFPVVQDDRETIKNELLQAIENQKGISFDNDFPKIGSIPNRFLAEVPEKFEGQLCVDAVQETWKALAEKIWNIYVAPTAALGKNSEMIWQRQVENFWDMSWVFGDAHDLLDRRKNWRSHILPEEPGDKCTLMGNWQELSGYIRRGEKEQQEKFWNELSDRSPGHDLRQGERLCAIALIKRFFPYLFKKEILSYPSTSYLAAVPWLADILKQELEREIAKKLAQNADSGMIGHENPYLFFNDNFNNLDESLQKFLSLDGGCFFESTLNNDRLWLEKERITASRKHMLPLLEKFKSRPSPFYALLVMDGDHIGALLGDEDKRIEVSRALKSFSDKVDDVIKKYKGITVYAGGDDVLALLPLDNALPAAGKLHGCYLDAFSGLFESNMATISAAILYAHHHAPLKQVITTARRILDDEAKDKTGRDALAIAVWKTGGVTIKWSAPWQVRQSDNKLVPVNTIIAELVNALNQKQLTNSWIYNIRKLLGNSRGNEFELAGDIDYKHLFAAELVDSRNIDIKIQDTERIVQTLLTICFRQWRDAEGNVQCDKRTFSLDGALLIKFLVTKGVI